VADLTLIEAFLNTVDERTFVRNGTRHVAGEHLTSPQALAEWLTAHGLAAAGAPVRAADLTVTKDLRTALRETLDGDADDGTATATALARYPLRLEPGASGELHLAAASGRPWLDVIVETVARSVARDDWKRIKLCAAADCRWAFHDTSRNGRGRWCDMEVCGNRHKTRTYRERRRQT